MNDAIAKIISDYPVPARELFETVRWLIFDVGEAEGLDGIEETLKWGEPAYHCASGSTVRVSWKPAYPDRISLFFNCQTRLISTFREICPDAFEFHGNREVSLPLSVSVPEEDLRLCLSMALRYHRIKHLPLLGA